VPEITRGVLYLCHLEYQEGGIFILTVFREVFFETRWETIEAYASIPNPESQMASGKTYEELCIDLHLLHENMKDQTWLEELNESI
jgi:hypothetical protein